MISLISKPPANPGAKIPVHARWYVVDCSAIFGKSIGELQIGKLSGCMVLAVSRAGVCLELPDRHFMLVENDRLYVAGTHAQLAFFERVFGISCISADSSAHKKRIA